MTANPTDPPIASDPIGMQEEPTCGARPDGGSFSTVTLEEPRTAAPRPGAKSTTARSGGVLARMRKPSDPPSTPDPIYIDEQELSQRTTLSRTTLQTMRRKGGGPPWAKLGHRVVYRLADVERWIAERTR